MNKFVILFALILTVSFSSAFSQSIGNQQKFTPEKNSKERFGETIHVTNKNAIISASCMGDIGKVEATIGTYIIRLK